ncbi:MAG: DUF4139 domain-containing protein [Betaproteobacteria bacterium]|nr:DUF4139 domain-containing protein [Betaproteobacteria bacterium]
MTVTPPLRQALAAALVLAASPVGADDTGSSALTIYGSASAGAVPVDTFRSGGVPGYHVPGYAVVRQERTIPLVVGRNEVRFTDVAGLIDPTTVSFQSLTDPAGTRVIEQDFRFDLVSTDKLLQKYVDAPITVEQVRGGHAESFAGTLLSTRGGIVLRQSDGSVRTFSGTASVTLPSLPGGLITRPTLVWEILARNAGTHRTRVAYQTSGITWWADYNLVYSDTSQGDCRVDANAWVSILNQSGASYSDARIKLIAGDVHRAPTAALPSAKLMMRANEAAMDATAGFAEKSFFEYHLYTLGRTTTLPDNSTKQLELFPAVAGIACEKTLVYAGQNGSGYGTTPLTTREAGTRRSARVETFLSFRNTEDNELGVPLPAGRVRVSKRDAADGSLEFIGEDRIDHTPRNETVTLNLGSAFDVVGERRQTDFDLDTGRRTMTESFEIRVRNHKERSVEVIVRESLFRWANWRIVSASQAFEKEDARTIRFRVPVAADAEGVVRYTVRYAW